MSYCLFILVLLMSFIVHCNAFELVQQHRPKACIVISRQAPNSVTFAAQELKEHIKKISKAELSITNKPQAGLFPIYLGASKWTQKYLNKLKSSKPDSFIIKTFPDKMIIIGRDYSKSGIISGTVHPLRKSESYNAKVKICRFGETGTLYGVYAFLRRLGVRWYMPGKLGTVIPHKDSISLNNSIDIFQSPDFEYRLLYACDFPKDEEGALWYRRAGFGAPFPLQVNHSFHLLKIYKEKHPGIFALKNGKRDFSQSCMGAGNLCLSNPETAELFVKYIIDFFKKHPKKEVFPVVPNDGLIEICECKNCQSQIRKDKDNTGK